MKSWPTAGNTKRAEYFALSYWLIINITSCVTSKIAQNIPPPRNLHLQKKDLNTSKVKREEIAIKFVPLCNRFPHTFFPSIVSLLSLPTFISTLIALHLVINLSARSTKIWRSSFEIAEQLEAKESKGVKPLLSYLLTNPSVSLH